MAPILLLGATCNDGAKIKVWQHGVEESCKDKPGFYRENGESVMTYLEGDKYYCVSPQDMEYILNKLKQCQDTPLDNNSIMDMLLANENNYTNQ